MSTRRPRVAESEPLLGADDFKLISGIGPGIAQRLYDAGILTFEQLASLSVDEIVERIGNQGGLSPTRIREEDWTGQAHDLAASKASQKETVAEAAVAGAVARPVAGQPFEVVQELHQRYATFTFELLLGPDGAVRRTRVAHIQSSEQTEPKPTWDKTWPGWDPERMVGFIVQQAKLSQGSVGSTGTTAAPSPLAPMDTTPPEREPLLELREMTIVPFGESKAGPFVPQGRSFGLQLQLALKHSTPYGAQPLSYTATLNAKKLGVGTIQNVGLARGSFTSAEPIIRVAGMPLPPGLYRLNADVTLKLPATDSSSPTEIAETLQGGLVQIY